MAVIESGGFKLMRNIDIDHQPSRSEVYNEWIKALVYDAPKILDNFNLILEDIEAFELWKDSMLPDFYALAERYLRNLDPDLLAEHAKTIKQLRERSHSKRVEIQRRAKQVKALREQGLTQQQIADQLGVSRPTVSADLMSENNVYTQKTDNEPRKIAQYKITEYTKPETAAQKIRQKLGDKFADELKRLL